MPARGPRPRGAETREILVRAALSVVERDGIAAATTRRIADEAGLPLGAVHYWFANKADLLSAVIEALVAEVRVSATGGAPTEALEERLSSLHREYASMPLGRQLALFEVTTHAIRTDGLRELASEQYDAYTSAAMEGIEKWRERADEVLPGGASALAALVVAVIDGLTLAELALPRDPDRAASLALFVHLLRAAGLTDPGESDDRPESA